MGGNNIQYPGCVATPTADIPLIKLFLNSVVSTPNAKFMTIDISNFYLGTTMPRSEYMVLPANIIPHTYLQKYQLQSLIQNGKLYIHIDKGMYGLPQAGKLAQDQLIQHLQKYGYHPCKHTGGLWKHAWCPITFSLVVDDFGVKYVDHQHAQHLVQCLKEHDQDVTTNWDGNYYCGIHLQWNYNERTVDLDLPGYITTMLAKYNHVPSTKKQDSPQKFLSPSYGAHTQKPIPDDASEQLSPQKYVVYNKYLGPFCTMLEWSIELSL